MPLPRKPFFKIYTDSELKEKLKYYSNLYGTNQSQVINLLVSGWVDEVEKVTPLRNTFNLLKGVANPGGQ